MNQVDDIEAFRLWVGREDDAADRVTPELVKRFCATFDAAMSLPLDGLAPVGIHWCLAPPAPPTATLGPDGHPARGGFLPPIPLPRRMWAGGRLTLGAPIPVGADVQRHSRIEDVVLKEGRSGPLCFVTVGHRITVDGVVAMDERQDIVYRGLEATPASLDGEARSQPEREARWTRTIEADPPLLFRYSALTFNGHRIHYDRRYCREQEGYPGLVVHGPLQATLLLRFATEIHGDRPPKTFAFRSTAPLFDGASILLNATETTDGLHLWTADAGGGPAMRAEASW